MHYSKQKFEDFLNNSRSILDLCTRDEELRQAVANFGYDEERLSEGRQLFDELVRVAELQEATDEERRLCFERKSAFQTELSADYMKYLKIARIVFNKNEEAYLSLALKGQRARTYEKWYHQVSVFANNLLANKEYLGKMSSFGIKEKNIKILKQNLDKIQRMSEECTRLSARVSSVVKDKKTRMIKWQGWLSDFVKIVRIAIEDTRPEDKKRLKQLLTQGE